MMNESNKKTIICAVKYAAQILLSKGVPNAFNDSFELLASLNGMDRAFYYSHGDDELSDKVYERFLQLVEMRANRIPLQHILGKTWFYGNEFIVNEHVLVPRPDTEILVDEALKVTDSNSSVLDMCTGSGCIILTIGLMKHLKYGMAVDLSDEALKVARANDRKLEAGDITFVKSDLFSEIKDYKFNCIVSNPPYIKTSEIEKLDEEVKYHDPIMALDGFDDGLTFYRKITSQAVNYLEKDGWLLYEIGYDQAEDVTGIMLDNGFKCVEVVKDYSGLDRVVKGRY